MGVQALGPAWRERHSEDSSIRHRKSGDPRMRPRAQPYPQVMTQVSDPLDGMVRALIPSLSRSLEEQFSIFRVMRHGTHEKQISNVFAWLLRPDASHKLGAPSSTSSLSRSTAISRTATSLRPAGGRFARRSTPYWPRSRARTSRTSSSAAQRRPWSSRTSRRRTAMGMTTSATWPMDRVMDGAASSCSCASVGSPISRRRGGSRPSW